MISFSASVDGVPEFERAFNRVEGALTDFRFVWPSLAAQFYEIEREQFASQGAHGASGSWAPLSPAYAKYKAIAFAGQPILRATTSLYESLTSSGGHDSVLRMDAQELTIGTQREGATAHQRGTPKMPARPPISLTEADKRRLQKAIQLPLVQFIRRQGLEVVERAA